MEKAECPLGTSSWIADYRTRLASLRKYYTSYGQGHVLSYLEYDVTQLEENVKAEERRVAIPTTERTKSTYDSIGLALKHFESVDLARVERIYSICTCP